MTVPGAPPTLVRDSTRGVHARQILGGAVLASLAAWLIHASIGFLTRVEPPPGWHTVRPPADVMCLALDRDILWVGAKDGLTAFDPRTAAPLRSAPLLTRPVYALLPDGRDGILVGHEDGLSLITPTGRQEFPLPTPPDAQAVLALTAEPSGTVWVGCRHALFRLAEGAFTPVPLPAALAQSPISALFFDASGDLWIGSDSPTHGGVCRLAGSAWTCFDAADGVPHPAVNAISADGQGRLWLATGFASRGGAGRRTPGGFAALTQRDGLAGDNVRTIFADSAGGLWFGSEYDGLAIVRGKRSQILSSRSGLAGDEVRAIVETNDGGFWIGTNQGLTRIDPGAAQRLEGKGAP